MTGGGPVKPKGVGTAVFEIEFAPGKFRSVQLQNALYIPGIDLNIFSRDRHYRSRGYLTRNKLFWRSGAPLATLNTEKTGFFLPLKGIKPPTAFYSGYSSIRSYSTRYVPPSELATPLEIQLAPPYSKEKAREYQKFSDISESSGSETIPSRFNSAPEISSAEPDSLGERPSVPKEVKSVASQPKPSTTGPSGGRPSVPERPVENRGTTTMEDLEDLLSEGLPLFEQPGNPPELLKLALLWHQRLGHPSLSLLKKTAKITQGIPNFSSIKESEFHCLACDRAKTIRRLKSKPIQDPLKALDSLEGDTFSSKPMP